MRGSRKFCQRGSNFDHVFFFCLFSVDKGREDSNTAISGPPHHLNGVSLTGRWWPNTECWLCSFVVSQGSKPVLLRNPIFLRFFRSGTWTPPLDPRMNFESVVESERTRFLLCAFVVHTCMQQNTGFS